MPRSVTQNILTKIGNQIKDILVIIANVKLSNLNFEKYKPEEFWGYHKPGSNISIMAFHAEKYYMAKSQGDWDDIIRKIDIFIGDGIGLSLGYKFLTGRKVVKCSGVDLIEELVDKYPKTPTFIWGTTKENIKKAAAAYKKRGLNLVGFHDGFSGSPNEIIDEINRSGAKVCFVGMSGKKQMEMVVEVNEKLNITSMSAGGSFDVAGGEFRRAPLFFQKIGLEWLWRMLSDPKRFRRLPALLGFVWYVVLEKFSIKNEK